jgi:hypothetical protein
MKRYVAALTACSALLLAPCCGRKPEHRPTQTPVEEAPSPSHGGALGTSEEAPKTGGEGPTLPAGSSSITGKVLFRGEPPLLQPVRMDADPTCAALHATPVLPEEVIIDAGGTLRNVFVYVRSGLERSAFPPPEEAVVLDQKGCRFIPHVFGIRTRQKLRILNGDGTYHNVHALTRNQEGFNLAMPAEGAEVVRSFTRPEVMVKFKCEVHPWMAAYCGVLDHSFFAVTGEGGAFALRGLPAGRYVVEAWHERYGTAERTVELKEGAEAEIVFEFGEEG